MVTIVLTSNFIFSFPGKRKINLLINFRKVFFLKHNSTLHNHKNYHLVFFLNSYIYLGSKGLYIECWSHM